MVVRPHLSYAREHLYLSGKQVETLVQSHPRTRAQRAKRERSALSSCSHVCAVFTRHRTCLCPPSSASTKASVINIDFAEDLTK